MLLCTAGKLIKEDTVFNFDAGPSGQEGNDIDSTPAEGLPYEKVRDLCVDAYSRVYRDDIAFELHAVPKSLAVRLLDDPVYKSRTRSMRAKMYASQISTLTAVERGEYGGDTKDQSRSILSALQAKNELIFRNLSDAGEDDKLNIEFIAMTREDFMADDKTEVHIGSSSNASLSGGDEASKEDKLKEDAKRLLEKQRETPDA